MADSLMTIQDVADYLGVARHTVYQWRYRGEGPIGFRVGGQVRYRRELVDEWIEAHADERNPAA